MGDDNKKHIYEQSWCVNDCNVIDCKTCGFIHVNPIPDKERLRLFYQQEYHTKIKTFDYSTVNESYVKQKREEVKSQPGYIHVYNLVNRLLSRNVNGKSMLDIGCGNDLLASYFQDHFWDSNVLEPNKDAANYLRMHGLKVYELFAEEMDQVGLSNLSFVNIQFVLEHVADPEDLLRKIYDAMAPGGLIRVCVPNDFSEGQMAYKEYYNKDYHWVVSPDHVNYFSFTSLSQLLGKAGFDEVHRTTNFPLEFFLLGGMDYYNDEVAKKGIGPFVHQFQQAFVRTGRGAKLNQLFQALAQLELGRSILMIAKKR